MNDVIVTDAHNTVIVGTQEQTTVVTVDQAPRTIVTGMMGPSGSSRLSDAHDVDLSDLNSGSLLVYNPTVSKWVATLTLDQQYMDGGHF